MEEAEFQPRYYASADEIRRIGTAFLACSLARSEWTHEAHLATCLWLIHERSDIHVEQEIPDLIRKFNESVGGVNDDHQGYHQTITLCFVRGVRSYLARRPNDEPLDCLVNSLLASPEGKRDWPLRFFTRERLFSVEARRAWVEPDIRSMPLV